MRLPPRSLLRFCTRVFLLAARYARILSPNTAAAACALSPSSLNKASQRTVTVSFTDTRAPNIQSPEDKMMEPCDTYTEPTVTAEDFVNGVCVDTTTTYVSDGGAPYCSVVKNGVYYYDPSEWVDTTSDDLCPSAHRKVVSTVSTSCVLSEIESE